MAINRHEAMWAYLMKYPELYSYLRFNTVEDTPDEASMTTSYSETWEKRYLHGHGIKRYDFAVIIMKPYDSGTSSLNINELFNVQKFMNWIDEQNNNRNFPDFGEDAKILSIGNLQNMPNLAGVNSDGAVAKYMFQCRVRYYI